LCESGHRGLLIVARLVFCRRHVADRLEQPAMIKPVDPVERGKFDRLEMPPRAESSNDLGLKRPMIDSASALSYESPRLPTEWGDPGVGEPVGVAHRQVLRPAVTVMDESRVSSAHAAD